MPKWLWKEKGLSGSQFLMMLVSHLAAGKTMKQRNEQIRKAFKYADEHGYDAAIGHYGAYLERRNKAIRA